MPMVTSVSGTVLSAARRAYWARRVKPEQQGTSMWTTVRLLGRATRRISVSFLAYEIHLVQLGAPDEDRFVPEESLVEFRIGERDAIRDQQDVRTAADTAPPAEPG